MDFPPFALNALGRTLHAAGVRFLLKPEPVAASSLLAGPFPPLGEPWSTMLAKLPVGAKTVWTYWELGSDMGGAPHAQRSQLWRSLMALLKWPKGSVGFWPYTELKDGTITPATQPFLAGLRQVRARSVVVFGGKAFLTYLGLSGQEPDPGEVLGVPVFEGPPPEDVLGFSSQELSQLAERLQVFFAALPDDA